MILGRHWQSGERLRIEIAGESILGIAILGTAEGAPDDLWIAPAFWDIQTNGRWGISYSHPDLAPEQVSRIVHAQAVLGVARLCPTLITAPQPDLIAGVRAIAASCDADPVVAAMVLGIHLEGPGISEVDGYRGAHPREAVRDPDWDEFRAVQDASGGRVAIVTLAPERPRALGFIERLSAEGVLVAIGHTAADGPTIRRAVEAGARLATHLGNGIASPLARHPNPIWDQAACDGLWASLIADGHHLDDATLRVLARAKGIGRAILVSDASPLAGLPPGRHGAWEVEPSGRVVVAGTPYLAGASAGLETAIHTMTRAAGWTTEQAIEAASVAPARLLGREEPAVEAGRPANLIAYRRDPFRLVTTWVDGRRVEVDAETTTPGAGSPGRRD